MYTPSFNRIDDDDEIRRFVAAARSAEFVTVDPDGLPVATLLPIMWDGDTSSSPTWRAPTRSGRPSTGRPARRC